MNSGVLYVVATPIGNLDDMTPRAIQTLKNVSVVAAEDTRHSARLLQHFGVGTSMISHHDHNEKESSTGILAKLQQGDDIALISDAGTPLISDPGYRLVKTVREHGIKVVPVIGACALVGALSVSGLPTDKFRFVGFLPAKGSQRLLSLAVLQAESATLVFYESSHRILASLKDMATTFGDRPACIARELTKMYETVINGTLAELVEVLEQDLNQQKGEFVVMVQGAPQPDKKQLDDADLKVLDILLEELSVKQASALAAKITGKKKQMLYQYALECKGS